MSSKTTKYIFKKEIHFVLDLFSQYHIYKYATHTCASTLSDKQSLMNKWEY